MENFDEPLVFKGMPRLRYTNTEVLESDARRSPYYWWWAYLRLSKDYWLVCRRDGLGADMRLRGMYRDFGRVYEMTFAEWLKRRGARLFSEQLGLPDVRELNPYDLRLNRDIEKHLLLEIPINMTERTIISRVRKLLREHPQREVARVSTARRKLAKLVRIRQDVIESAHAVWRLHYESRDGREASGVGQVKGTKSLYQIGKELRLVKTCMPVATDSKERAAKRVNGMKVATSRMLARANNLIANAAIGIFPSMEPLKDPITWRLPSDFSVAEIVAEEQWRPLFDANDTLIVP